MWWWSNIRRWTDLPGTNAHAQFVCTRATGGFSRLTSACSSRLLFWLHSLTDLDLAELHGTDCNGVFLLTHIRLTDLLEAQLCANADTLLHAHGLLWTEPSLINAFSFTTQSSQWLSLVVELQGNNCFHNFLMKHQFQNLNDTKHETKVERSVWCVVFFVHLLRGYFCRFGNNCACINGVLVDRQPHINAVMLQTWH